MQVRWPSRACRDFSNPPHPPAGSSHHFIDTDEHMAMREERRVGEARKAARSMVISTKFGAQSPEWRAHERRLPASCPLSLEHSLRRLPPIPSTSTSITPAQAGRSRAVAAFLQKPSRRQGQSRRHLNHGLAAGRVSPLPGLPRRRAIPQEHDGHSPVLSPWVRSTWPRVIRGAFAAGRLSGRYFHQPPDFSPEDIRRRLLSPASPRNLRATPPSRSSSPGARDDPARPPLPPR